MADVFVSYSRHDAAFVHRLVHALDERGKDVWVDVDGIRDGEVFPAVLRTAVESSDGFVFVISPDSVASAFCEQEVQRASELNKRIVPLLRRRVGDERMPQPVRDRNWIPFDDDAQFEGGVERLVDALDTDVELLRAHTRWLLKGLEWEREGRDRSFLLRGAELAAAERWLAESAGRQPEPTPLQRDYLFRSRSAATRRLRALAGAMAVALAVAVALGVVALSQRNAARHQSDVAQSRALAALSASQVGIDPERAILLAAEGVRTQTTPQAMLALRTAIDASSLRLTLRHRELVRRVAFSPRGDTIATAAPRDAVRLWSARTGRSLRVIRSGIPTALAFSPDGATLAVARDYVGAVLYDVATGRERRAFGGSDRLTDVRYSEDGRTIVTAGLAAGLSVVKLWDARTLAPRRTLDLSDRPLRAVLSPDGRTLAAGTDSGVEIWDARNARRRRVIPGEARTAVAFSPDGRQLAFGGEDRRVRLLDTSSLRITKTLAHTPAGITVAVAFSPDGSLLATGSSDGVARLWDVATGRAAGRFEGHRCCVNDVAFSPDGSLFATSSKDRTARVWSTRGNVLASTSVGRDAVVGLSFAPDGRLVYAAARGATPMRWTPGEAPVRLRGARGARELALSADGSLLAVSGAGTDVRVLDTGSGRAARTLQAHSVPNALAFDRRDGLLAVAGTGGTTIFRAGTGAIVGELALGQTARDAAFGPPGDTVALALESEQGDFRLESGSVVSAVSLWRPTGGDLAVSELPQSDNRVDLVGFSPDGSLLVSAEEGSTTVSVSDVRRRREVRVLLGHTEDVTGAAFSGDGRLLATSSLDRTVRVWDPRSGRQLRTIPHERAVTAVAFSPDGRRLATGDDRGTVRTWDACSGCLDAGALLATAERRVTRTLTPVERATFLGGTP